MPKQKRTSRILKHLLLACGYGLLGVVIALVVVYLKSAASGPDLKPWHEVWLDEEFTASSIDQVSNLAAYIDVEDRLFDQLQSEVYDNIEPADRRRFNRFTAGSVSDPNEYPVNWNRTYVLHHDNPRAGILMLHGLSDSPYSLRAMAQFLNRQGFFVVGLRLPGHGTVPSGLAHATADDFVAAVRMAAREVHSSLGDGVPFYIAGYSNGATLTINYTLSALNGEDLPLPDGLILVSPAVAVSPMAALAKWQRRLAVLPGLEKLVWNSIHLEYDPYKYNSFAVNAGAQISRLTQQNDAMIRTLNQGSGITGFPPVLALQSVADATVSTPAVVDRFMRHLSPNGHQLVLFDINRQSEAEAFLTTDYQTQINQLMEGVSWPFAVTLVTNRNAETPELMARSKNANSPVISEEPLDLAWPRGVYSLSHVALPFPPDDPVYGIDSDLTPDVIHLGRVELRGERHLLAVSPTILMRLRCNPFYPYLESRLLEFLGVDQEET
jgi:esterase/lipase